MPAVLVEAWKKSLAEAREAIQCLEAEIAKASPEVLQSPQLFNMVVHLDEFTRHIGAMTAALKLCAATKQLAEDLRRPVDPNA